MLTSKGLGSMIRAYRTEDTDLVVAVDFMPNDSGILKELPEDIGSYAEAHSSTSAGPF